MIIDFNKLEEYRQQLEGRTLESVRMKPDEWFSILDTLTLLWKAVGAAKNEHRCNYTLSSDCPFTKALSELEGSDGRCNALANRG